MAIGKYKEWLEEDNLLLIAAWARDGLTNEQIAHNMGITRETLNQWCKSYSAISDSLKKGKQVVDIQVENALFKRAIGYKYEEVKTETEGGIVTKVTKTIKEVLPDTTAQIFWLKNRKPAEWRDKREVENSFTSEIENLTPLAEMLRIEKDV